MRPGILFQILVLSSVVFMSGAASRINPPESKMPAQKIIDFADPTAHQSWAIVNDVVMGGRSSSAMRAVDEGFAEFSGDLSLENNGGFASTRSAALQVGLGDFDGLLIRVKGDGRVYRLRLRTTTTPDGIAYQREFPTMAGEWSEIALPFNEFVASYRGRLMPERGPVNAAEIKQVGFLIADKRPGPFTLKIAWIAAYLRGDRMSPETDEAGTE